MSKRLTLRHIVKKAEFGKNIELIDVKLPGNKITLLRVKEMPEFAFVMWPKEHQSTLTQIVFHLDKNKDSEQYTVVCACCPSETYGLKSPSEEERVKWRTALAEKFKETVLATCHAHGITTLFMRRAECWDDHYGKAEGICIVEARYCHEAYLELYGRKIIAEALRSFSLNC